MLLCPLPSKLFFLENKEIHIDASQAVHPPYRMHRHKNECLPSADETWHSIIIVEPEQVQQALTDKVPLCV